MELCFYRDDRGSVPLIEWLKMLPGKVRIKCLARLERLEALGHELRRPEADYLGDDIYELRVRFRSTNYRMLYFFAGKSVVVVSHGFTKERQVPLTELALALKRRGEVLRDRDRYTFHPEE